MGSLAKRIVNESLRCLPIRHRSSWIRPQWNGVHKPLILQSLNKVRHNIISSKFKSTAFFSKWHDGNIVNNRYDGNIVNSRYDGIENMENGVNSLMEGWDCNDEKQRMVLKVSKVDNEGKVWDWETVTVNKIDFCKKHGLFSRDLRKIDPNSPGHKIPSILPRQDTILVVMLNFRVLIKHNIVILIDTPGKNSFAPRILKDLRERASLQNKNEFFELNMLEVILNSVLTQFLFQQRTMTQKVFKVLERINGEIGEEQLRNLLEVNRELIAFDHVVHANIEVIEEILDNEDDLISLYLTKPQNSADASTHIDAELILEHYLSLLGGISQNNQVSISDLNTTKMVINSVLNSRRNDIIRCELLIALWTLAISTGALLVGLFGMNLRTGLETWNGVFYLIALVAIIIPVIIYFFVFTRMKRFMSFSIHKSRTSPGGFP